MLTRREGIQAAAPTALSYARILGANGRVQLGPMGAGDCGKYVASLFQKTGQVHVRTVCGVRGERAAEAIQQSPGAAWFSDRRGVVEDKHIDAVPIATPDHWHRAIAIEAMEAGKDVCVEKTASFSVGVPTDRITAWIRKARRSCRLPRERARCAGIIRPLRCI